MLFSGADIVRSSDQLKDRFEVLAGGKSGQKQGVAQVQPSQATENNLSQEKSKDALFRFAKFMTRPKVRKPLPKAHRFFSFTDDERGKLIDIYA